MTVIVLTAVVSGLRGSLTRWLMEVAPGVFVGRISQRVRERVWERIEAKVGDGQAVMLYPSRTEQGFQIRTAGRDRWTPVDYDGMWLMRRPAVTALTTKPAQVEIPEGW